VQPGRTAIGYRLVEVGEVIGFSNLRLERQTSRHRQQRHEEYTWVSHTHKVREVDGFTN
jgi:hypothetical protein